MKKNLITASLSFLLFACSPSDHGKQFSDISRAGSASTDSLPNSGTDSLPDSITPEACPFSGVNFNSEQEYNPDLLVAFNKTLKKYVNKDGLVSYFKFRKNKRDLASLCNMMAGISNAKLATMDSSEKTVFLVNAYNTFTLSLPLVHYESLLNFDSRPIRSIRNIKSLGSDIFSVFEFKIAEQTKTLSNIEETMLAPLGDARIPFALSCASLGCPKAQSQLLSINSLDKTLNNLAKKYINNRERVIIDFYGEGEGGELLIPNYLMSKNMYFKADKERNFNSPLDTVVYFLDQKQLEDDGLDFKKEDLLKNEDELWFIDENTFNWSIDEKL